MHKCDNMDSRQLTSLLSLIADTYESNYYMGSKFKPEYTIKKLKDKFPTLTEAQVKHILRII